MTEHVLDYDRSIVRQETGFWCGPAAAQVVLNGAGVRVAEADLARAMGTTTNGTDHVGLVQRALAAALPAGRWVAAYMPNDPPTTAQREALWRALVASIDAGYGVVMNWVAPPSNKPRGVKGSVSPAYSGGTTFHYVAAMGYDDDQSGRSVWIADSGFQPQGYWVSFAQCATLIPPKGYVYSAAPARTPPTPTPKQFPADWTDRELLIEAVTLLRAGRKLDG